MKPTTNFGGAGIVFGNRVDSSTWEKTLTTAIEDNQTYIFQEFINPEIRKAANLQGEMEFSHCIGGLCFDGQFSGLFIRELPIEDKKGIINISQGASYGFGFYCGKNMEYF